MAVVKRLPVHHHRADYIFWSFGINEFIQSHLKKLSLAKADAKGRACLSRFITGHEQTRLNHVLYFLFFSLFLASKGPACSELIQRLSQIIIHSNHGKFQIFNRFIGVDWSLLLRTVLTIKSTGDLK